MYYFSVRLIYAIYGPVYMVQIQINKKNFKSVSSIASRLVCFSDRIAKYHTCQFQSLKTLRHLHCL